MSRRAHLAAQLQEQGHIDPRPIAVRLSETAPHEFKPMLSVDIESGRVTLDERPEWLREGRTTKRVNLGELLTTSELKAATAIASRLRGGSCQVSTEGLSHELGFHRSVVMWTLRLMAAAGLIRFKGRGRAGTRVQALVAHSELVGALGASGRLRVDGRQ